MKILILKTLSLILISSFVQANDIIIKKKNYNKTYAVNNNVQVELNSTFGDIKYVIGSNKQVEFNAEVIVDGPNENDVIKKLNSISVEFSNGTNWVKANTLFKNYNARKTNIKINYIIKIPQGASIKVNGTYLNISLADNENKVDISGAYLDVKSTGNISNLLFSGAYGDLFLHNVGKAEIHSAYGDIKANTINNLEIEGAYSDSKIEEVNTIEINGAYSEIEIGTLTGNGHFQGAYGDFIIRNISSSVKNIEFTGAYSDVDILCNNNSSIEIKGSYADVKYPKEKYHIVTSTYKNKFLNFQAQTSSNPSTQITVTGAYCDVDLK